MDRQQRPTHLSQHHPQDEDEEGVCGRRNPKRLSRHRLLQNPMLDRNPINPTPVLTQQQAVMHVQMQKARHQRIESKIMLGGRYLTLSSWKGLLETKLLGDTTKCGDGMVVDQQIDFAIAAAPPMGAPVTLPLA